MTTLVPRKLIEETVGTRRQNKLHVGRMNSKENAFYILHSKECLESGIDLRDCEYSVALDNGIKDWDGWEDNPHFITISDGMIVPLIRLILTGYAEV